ncbi:sulfotransferase family 2 domain-containing protein [Chroococcus sp. FPU101]|uniref:sulfotransferase family 2 domain-containing protein n=1 Tax=Chroococcus sp. FPU101 TaxID=1974212 RepID=UPI001A90B97F|nr:sulfotransferase family 2 domain-containing protein [Chroococcus sp. FPU101]
MIISHKHKYIFIKTQKTAGSSIEIFLSRFCSEDDIITPLSLADEKIRQEWQGCTPRNYTRPLKLIEYRLEHLKKLIIHQEKGTKNIFWPHMPAKSIKAIVGEEIWNSYFKFCFVRNPWDAVISRYYWYMNKSNETTNHVELDDFLNKFDPHNNFYKYTINDELAVDYVGKYEALIESMRVICQKIGLPFDDSLPRAKSQTRKDKRHYSTIFNEVQADYVKQKCLKEIELFGYIYENK